MKCCSLLIVSLLLEFIPVKSAEGQFPYSIDISPDRFSIRDNCKGKSKSPNPYLELRVTPPKLYASDPINFAITNSGGAPAEDVTLDCLIERGSVFLAASGSGNYDPLSRSVTWVFPRVEPNTTTKILLWLGGNDRGHFIKFSATAAGGHRINGQIVPPISWIILEVEDTKDPVEIGTDTTYIIRITNLSHLTESNIVLTCYIPDKMDFQSAEGPTRFHRKGNQVVFEPLHNLGAHSEVYFRIVARGISSGKVRFCAKVSSPNWHQEIHESESTTVDSEN